MLERYPDLTIEVVTDIVAERIDTGVRLGDTLAADIIAAPITAPMRLVTIAATGYLQRQPLPQTSHDLTQHRCINLRLPTHGGLYPWEFARDGQAFHVRVAGPLTMNSVLQILQGCLDGVGLAQLPDGLVVGYLAKGDLVEVLNPCSEPLDGYHLYYPSRRQHTAAFKVVLEALRSF